MSKNDLVPGEYCFNLNFSNPGGFGVGSAVSLDDSSSAANSSSAPSTMDSPQNGQQQQAKFINVLPPEASGRGGGKGYLPNGKKTKGRVKIKMEFIDNKLRRYTTFSKRKTGIMKKAYELSTLTGTQVMLLVASETGHVYTFATKKLQPMITSEAGKALIQTCLNSPDDGALGESGSFDLSVGKGGPKAKKSKNSLDEELLISENSGGSSKGSYLNGQLPTMVQPSSFRMGTPQSGGDNSEAEDDSDDEDSLSPPGGDVPSDSGGSATPDNGMALMRQQQQALAQMLFPGANLLPVSSGAGNNPASFGLLPSIGPGGTVMYQMPQGVVYAASPTSESGQNGGGLILGSTNGQPGSQQQQYITIPVPLSLQQMVSSASSQPPSTTSSLDLNNSE